jgi:hypothetical protein
MMAKGLFTDENGKMSAGVKNKILELLGYSAFVGQRDIDGLHRARCGQENIQLKKSQVAVKSYDDHAIHIDEHTAFLLTDKMTAAEEARFVAHIDEHKKYLKQTEDTNNG